MTCTKNVIKKSKVSEINFLISYGSITGLDKAGFGKEQPLLKRGRKMLEEELSMLGEGPVFKEGSSPFGEGLASQQEL